MGRDIVWTKELTERLRILYPRHSGREVAEIMGLPESAVYNKASALGIKRRSPYVRVTLTPEQREWLRDNYADTPNDDIMARLGLKFATLHRLARAYGLTKSEEYVLGCRRRNQRLAVKANKRNNWPPKGYRIPNARPFQKGVTNHMRLGPEREAERRRKIGETRRATIAAERRRILFGLGQRTKMKLNGCFPKKSRLRTRMRKRGYAIERAGNTAAITPETRRSKRLEEQCEKMGLRLMTAE